MRRLLAHLLAIFLGTVVLGLSLLFAWVQNRPGSQPAAPPGVPDASAREESATAPPEGRRVFEAARCGACHSVGETGNRRGSLDGVGSRLGREELRRWILEPRTIDPSVRKPSYDHLGGEELEALLDYLESLR